MREFTCAMCGGVFTSDPSFTEEDREAEMEKHFGKVKERDKVSVCDPCFRKIDPANHPREVEEAVARDRRRDLGED